MTDPGIIAAEVLLQFLNDDLCSH